MQEIINHMKIMTKIMNDEDIAHSIIAFSLKTAVEEGEDFKQVAMRLTLALVKTKTLTIERADIITDIIVNIVEEIQGE